jgi:DNA-binding transcriptional regulator YiaG
VIHKTDTIIFYSDVIRMSTVPGTYGIDSSSSTDAHPFIEANDVSYWMTENMDNIIHFPGAPRLHRHHRIALQNPLTAADDIKAVRHKLGETQAKMARLLGCSRRSWQRWEASGLPPRTRSSNAGPVSLMLRWLDLETPDPVAPKNLDQPAP